MKRVLKPGGTAFISMVVGQRKRWFMAEEKLARLCFTADYYRKLFKNIGLKIVKEFELEEGQKPTYRRFLLTA